MLIVFAGLPGTGKSTIARALTDRLGAVWLRIDSIEQAIRAAGILPPGGEIGPAGYDVARRLAADNLPLGHTVIADSVNPLVLTRDAWRAVAAAAGRPCLEIEVRCSDTAEHRRRVETRPAEVAGLTLPDWVAVRARHFEPWTQPRLLLDTAALPVADSIARIIAALPQARVPEQAAPLPASPT